MTKIAMIGAGSVVFVKKLLADILAKPHLAGATIALHDIDAERLETAGMMARWTASKLGATATIEEHLDRRACIEGADFVINMVLVGGLEATRKDHLIPARYGLKQTVGDTVGIGGIMRAVRTIPFMLDLCEDIAELTDGAWLLNYTNPMSMLTAAVYRAFPAQKVIGLCHNVQHTSSELAGYLGVDLGRLSYECAGINHMTWFLRLEVDGEDAYPALRRAMNSPEIFAQDKVRFELMRQLGWFVSESSRHSAEYVPYFMRDDAEIANYDIPVSGTLKVGEAKILRYQRDRQTLLEGGDFTMDPSVEYGADIINAVVSNKPFTFYGNVRNTGLIDNLPPDCCVEVPVMVDRTGFHPCKAPTLPPELAAHCAPHAYVQELAVRSVLEGDRERLYRAVMLDRLAPAVMTISQMRSMVDDLIEAHGDAIPASLRQGDALRAAS